MKKILFVILIIAAFFFWNRDRDANDDCNHSQYADSFDNLTCRVFDLKEAKSFHACQDYMQDRNDWVWIPFLGCYTTSGGNWLNLHRIGIINAERLK